MLASSGRSSDLFFGNHVIKSEESIQQGDPLGPLLFCLSLLGPLQLLHSPFQIAFLDDVTIGGALPIVLQDINTLVKSSSSIGLSLNTSKSEVVGGSQTTLSSFLSLHPTFKQVDVTYLTLLGTPLHINGLECALKDKCDDLTRVVSRLKLLPFHDCLFLLKNIFSIPKLLYILRTAPTFLSPTLSLYDNILSNSISSLFNVSLSIDSSLQASLPVRLGGLGIRGAVVLAPSAFLASVRSTSDLSDLLLSASNKLQPDALYPLAWQHWQAIAPTDSLMTAPAGDAAHSQREWDHPLCTALADSLLARCATPAHQARLLAVRSPWAGDWLQAVPATNLGLHLDDATVTISLALRLGAHAVHAHT